MPQPLPERPVIAGAVVGHSPLRIWSIASDERLRRQLARAGATADAAGAGHVVLLRADWVYDDPLVRGLVQQRAPCGMWSDTGQCVALVVPRLGLVGALGSLVAGEAPANQPSLAPAQVAGSYNNQLRKREPQFLLPLTAAQLQAIEARVFAGSYKGVTDFVTLSWPLLV